VLTRLPQFALLHAHAQTVPIAIGRLKGGPVSQGTSCSKWWGTPETTDFRAVERKGSFFLLLLLNPCRIARLSGPLWKRKEALLAHARPLSRDIQLIDLLAGLRRSGEFARIRIAIRASNG
jgi:hypothetical protein